MATRLTPLLPIVLDDQKSEQVRRNHERAIAELQAQVRDLAAILERAGLS